MKKLLFLFVSSILLSCSNDSNDNSGETTNSVAFFKATVGSTTLNYIQDNSSNPSYYNQPYVGYSGISSNRSYYYAAAMVPFSGFDDFPSLELTMHNMYQSDDEASETVNFNTTFAVKPVNFITYEQDNNLVKGVSVTYKNANGDLYTTLAGSQDNSAIMYNTGVAGTNDFGFQTQTITGSVNCKLYNENDVNDVIVLTNGTFKLVFQEFD
ncbi:hypothetical protein GOQ30_11805 [Flavobacterium sp. TP390]|uniref:Lipoprotein n=1 Tax=Flavobacterium profundi TaxID=1774945 RepID=A0A6I4IJF0_9FLAO|nr:hypothetical protein [Flavobacterium profundi]MVO09845.1 hypothetical protein [Flavobacterium profundi]